MTYIHRGLEKDLKKYCKSKEIIAVVGPRQSGKTTLIGHFFKNLQNTHMISFDDIKTLELFEHDIDNFIELHIKGHDYVFIDEIQYSKDSGKKLKYIFDHHYTKLFISGSSATEISIQSIKYLVGRIFVFNLYPLSFREFLMYKNERLLNIINKKKYGVTIIKEINKYLSEFIIYGGYPKVVLSEDKKEKEMILKNIYNTYFLREIREILNLTEDYRLSKLIEALALQIGNIINYNELSEISGFSYQDLKKYLNILDKTFICKESKNFHTNKRQELKKSPKIFFFDTGFRNIIIEDFSKQRTDLGELYENFVATELIKKDKPLKYWRTKAKAEVDFIIGQIPLEIKSELKKPAITKSFLAFLERYVPKKAVFLSANLNEKRRINNSNVLFLPLFEIIQIEKYL